MLPIKMVNIIKGAMDELVVGKPTQLTTDIGPVIDAEAQQNLLAHINRMKGVAKAYHENQKLLPTLIATTLLLFVQSYLN